MNITRLQVAGFRNLEPGEIVPSNGINIIYGKNAQGKTNLLEAMWLFTGGKSFRGAKDSELVRFSEERAQLNLEFFSEERAQKAEIVIQNGKRRAVLNGIEKNSASSLVGRFCAVIFSPDHLSLIKEGPSNRRNFIDTALCQSKPSYVGLLHQYQRTLQQRNALLKDIPRHSELLDTLEIWDDKLSRYGGEIMRQRYQYILRLEEPAKEIYSGISQNQEVFGAKYQCGVSVAMNSPESFEKSLLDQLKNFRKEDIFFGFTTAGPHRDDMEVTINGVSARNFASQGQQRSIVLALKLAEAELLSQKIGENPVVFLDDVMSELDAERQDYLMNHLYQKQVFITCCEPESVKRLNEGAKFRMQNGVLTQQ